MIYDCFTYNGEKDILDIRMAILDPYVDFFVICESEQTFSGKTKPIYYTGNNPKVIHVIAPNTETSNAFERAGYQKDYIRTFLMDRCKDDDIVYFGDVDEIWKPQIMIDDLIYNLRQVNYSYYLNNRSSEDWVGTVVGRWVRMKTRSFNHWRAAHTNELDNGGWHFTNMGGAEQIRKKLESYDHQEYNTDDVKEKIEERMANGQDYVGRGRDWRGVPFEMRVDESDWPMYLIENRAKYEHLLKT